MIAGRRVTVLSLDSIGDLTMRQPLLTGLVDAGIDVTVVVRRYVAGLVPLVDPRLAAIVTPLSPWVESAAEDALQRLALLADAIRGSAPDLVVAAAFDRTWLDEWALAVVPGAKRVGLVDRAPSVPAAAVWAPYGLAVTPVPLDVAVECPKLDHESTKNAAILRALAWRDPDRPPRLNVGGELRKRARAVLRRHSLVPGRYAVGCPVGAANNDFKTWPVASYAAVVRDTFREHGLSTLLVGVARERPALEAVVAAAGGACAVWCGGDDDLGMLAALIAESRLYLGADTGPMHLAGAVGVPVVANVGGGHWPRFLPLARPAFVGTQRLPCFGCGWRCVFDRPRCVAERAAPFRDGMRWILSAKADGLHIDAGVVLDGATAAGIAAAAAAGAAPPEVAPQLDRALGRRAG